MEKPIEVELKFPIDDLTQLESQVIALGGVLEDEVQQEDEYLNDPLRDFAKQDKALRIRRVAEDFCLTYKGPNLDPTAKIRQEIEMTLVDRLAAEQIRDTFLGIGFNSVATVSKTRKNYSLVWDHLHVEVSLDDVAEVGTFVELELVVHRSTEVQVAKSCLQSLAEKLNLTGSIQTSYIAMLLKNRGEL